MTMDSKDIERATDWRDLPLARVYARVINEAIGERPVGQKAEISVADLHVIRGLVLSTLYSKQATSDAPVSALDITPPSRTYEDGVRDAARLIEKRRDDYIDESGWLDPDTDIVKYPGAFDPYAGELGEISDAILSLLPKEHAGFLRMCVNCGKMVDAATIKPGEELPECVGPEGLSGCSFDLTPHEAWLHWRRIAHERREEVERRKLEVRQLEEFIGRREDDVLAIARRAEAAEARVKELEDQRSNAIGLYGPFTPVSLSGSTTPKLTVDERDLLHYLVTGRNTRANGKRLVWGSWMGAVLESLLGKRLVASEEDPDTRAIMYFATDAGRRALQEGE